MRGKQGIVVTAAACLVMLGYVHNVSADRFSSPSYIIDASTMDSAGGYSSSTDYKLVSSTGLSIIGQGSSGSYGFGAGYVAQLASKNTSFSMTLQPGGLKAYYSFDNLANSPSVQPNEASVSASPLMNVMNGPLTSVAGKAGQGVALNGTSQYLQQSTYDSTFSVDPGQALTAEMWVKRARAGVLETLLWNVHACQGWYTTIESGNVISLDASSVVTDCSNQTSYWATDNLATADTNWHHVVAVVNRQAGTLTLYKDGAQVAASSGLESTSTWTNATQLRIGADWTPANYFSGSIDEVKIFSRALTAAEIKAEYDAQNAGSYSGLLLPLTPGIPVATVFDTIISTDASGYSLAINQDQNLTKGTDTIPAISVAVASPAAWIGGTTKGLGFSLVSTNATALDSKWNAGSNYAAIPSTATTIYSRSGAPAANTNDIITGRLKLDTSTAQAAGNYTNTITMTGTYTP